MKGQSWEFKIHLFLKVLLQKFVLLLQLFQLKSDQCDGGVTLRDCDLQFYGLKIMDLDMIKKSIKETLSLEKQVEFK